MKKNILTWAAAALVLAACSNHEENNEWAGEIRLSSGLTVQQTTRAATDIQSSQFDSGEQIDVYISEQTSGGQQPSATYDQPLVYTTGNNGEMNLTKGNQPYYPSSGNSVNIYAVYPSQNNEDGSPTGFKDDTFSVQTDQSTDAAYKASDLMHAAAPQVKPSANSVSLGFVHLLSKVTLTMKPGNGLTASDLVDATVALKDVKPTATFDAATGSVTLASDATAVDIAMMMVAADATSGSAIVIPQVLPTTCIEMKLPTGGVLRSNSLKDADGNTLNELELKSGYEYVYEITVNLTSLSVKASIKAWDGSDNKGEGEVGM